jgi:hypothetical protein
MVANAAAEDDAALASDGEPIAGGSGDAGMDTRRRRLRRGRE